MTIELTTDNKKFFFAELNEHASNVKISWNLDKEEEKQIRIFYKIFFPSVNINYNEIEIPLGLFIDKFPEFHRNLLSKFPSIKKEFEIDIKLRKLIADIPSYDNAILETQNFSREKIKEILKNNNFLPDLYEKNPDQLGNVKFMLQYPSAANFSVQGSGKTIEALAYYICKRKDKFSKILVVCPINAFTAWEDEIKLCFGENYKFSELRGDHHEVKKKIDDDEQFYITNYHKLLNEKTRNIITKELFYSDDEYFLIMDESHKMKGTLTGKAINEHISPLINNKIIMTGTPNPQSEKDLFSQFKHLYPREEIDRNDDLRNVFHPIFCRTRKVDLQNLPDLKIVYKPIEMEGALLDLYLLMVDRLRRQESLLDYRQQARLIEFKQTVMRLLQFSSNPLLQIDYIKNVLNNNELAANVEEEGNGQKFESLINDAIELCSKGNKLVIWSGYPEGINKIKQNLPNEFKPVLLHGQMEFGDSDIPGTRKHSIHSFKNDPDCKIFIANPAAAAEGISLHKVCNNAFYLDRDFNLANFLQSRDRIHRLGSDKEVNISIYQYSLPDNFLARSIDEKVDARLNYKKSVMEEFLGDNIFEPPPYPFIEEDDFVSSSDNKEIDPSRSAILNHDFDEDDLRSFIDDIKKDNGDKNKDINDER